MDSLNEIRTDEYGFEHLANGRVRYDGKLLPVGAVQDPKYGFYTYRAGTSSAEDDKTCLHKTKVYLGKVELPGLVQEYSYKSSIND